MTDGRKKVIFDCNALDRLVVLSKNGNEDIKNAFNAKYTYCQTPYLTDEMVGVIRNENSKYKLKDRCKFLLDITGDQNCCLRACGPIAKDQQQGLTVVYKTDKYYRIWKQALDECVCGKYETFKKLDEDVKREKEEQRKIWEEYKNGDGDPMDRLIEILGFENAVEINNAMKEPSANWLRAYGAVFYSFLSRKSLEMNDWWDVQQLVYLEEIDIIVSDDGGMHKQLKKLSQGDSYYEVASSERLLRIENFIDTITN